MDRSRYELILADNGGATPALDQWGEEENVRIVRWETNLGFAGGNNRAAALAAGSLVFLVNQDVVVHRDCLKALQRAFRQHPELNVIGANQQMTAGLEQLEPAGPLPSTVGLYRRTCLGYADYRKAPFTPEPIPVDFVSGNGLGFRRPLPTAMNGYLFDERLFAYAEDLDLSLRLKQNGCSMAVIPSAVVYHCRQDLSGGTARHRLKKFVHASGNRLLVYRRHLGPASFLQRLPLYLAGIAAKVGRMDEERRIHVGRFFAGALLAPLATLDFLIKERSQRRLPRPGGQGRRLRNNSTEDALR